MPGSTFSTPPTSTAAGKAKSILGRALKGRRDKVLIATKFGMKMGEGKQGAKPAYIRQAAEDSLRRLGTDHIDLYQIHQPDAATPIADTLGALDELVKAGKVREIGCSNFSRGAVARGGSGRRPGRAFRQRAEQLQPAASRAGSRGSAGVRASGTRVSAVFPAGQWPADGKVSPGPAVPEIQPRARTDSVRRCSPMRILRWPSSCAASPNRAGTRCWSWRCPGWLRSAVIASVIAGAKTPEQVKANASAVAWRLSEADVAAVDGILDPR